MSAHTGKKYEIKNTNHTYVIGICESPKEPCLENVGACRTTNGQSTSLGIANNNLQLKDTAIGTPFLQYKTGSACVMSDTTMSTRFTTIQFICLTDDMSAEPKIIEEYNCEIIIHFPTKAACQSSVSGPIVSSGLVIYWPNWFFRCNAKCTITKVNENWMWRRWSIQKEITGRWSVRNYFRRQNWHRECLPRLWWV